MPTKFWLRKFRSNFVDNWLEIVSKFWVKFENSLDIYRDLRNFSASSLLCYATDTNIEEATPRKSERRFQNGAKISSKKKLINAKTQARKVTFGENFKK